MSNERVPAGDAVEQMLSGIGVTEERTLKALNAGRAVLGLPPTKDCGCAGRKRLANKYLPKIPILGQKKQAAPAAPAIIIPPGVRPPVASWKGLVPPQVPDNWSILRQEKRALMVEEAGTGRLIVWQIQDGKYWLSHSFCCRRGAVEHRVFHRANTFFEEKA